MAIYDHQLLYLLATQGLSVVTFSKKVFLSLCKALPNIGHTPLNELTPSVFSSIAVYFNYHV